MIKTCEAQSPLKPHWSLLELENQNSRPCLWVTWHYSQPRMRPLGSARDAQKFFSFCLPSSLPWRKKLWAARGQYFVSFFCFVYWHFYTARETFWDIRVGRLLSYFVVEIQSYVSTLNLLVILYPSPMMIVLICLFTFITTHFEKSQSYGILRCTLN